MSSPEHYVCEQVEVSQRHIFQVPIPVLSHGFADGMFIAKGKEAGLVLNRSSGELNVYSIELATGTPVRARRQGSLYVFLRQ